MRAHRTTPEDLDEDDLEELEELEDRLERAYRRRGVRSQSEFGYVVSWVGALFRGAFYGLVLLGAGLFAFHLLYLLLGGP